MADDRRRPLPKIYTYADDLVPIISGNVPLPNFEPIGDLAYVINAIASGGRGLKAVWGHAKVPLSDRTHPQWAQYFLRPSAMGNANNGAFDGSGYVFIWNANGPIVGQFAICKHEKVTGAGANPSRGWHPGWCGKCGLDMTVDSGD